MNLAYTAIAVVIAATAAGVAGYGRGYASGKAVVQQAWDKEKAVLAQEHARNLEAVRETERNFQAAADRLRQEKDREIRNLSARATALSNSLRQRPDAPAEGGAQTSSAGDGSAAPGCTGAELYRSHGEFLVGEAARADTLRAELQRCYAQYETLRK